LFERSPRPRRRYRPPKSLPSTSKSGWRGNTADRRLQLMRLHILRFSIRNPLLTNHHLGSSVGPGSPLPIIGLIVHHRFSSASILLPHPSSPTTATGPVRASRDMVFLTVLRDYRVLVCTLCRYVINPQGVVSHLRTPTRRGKPSVRWPPWPKSDPRTVTQAAAFVQSHTYEYYIVVYHRSCNLPVQITPLDFKAMSSS
jgi:hypothetical protein